MRYSMLLPLSATLAGCKGRRRASGTRRVNPGPVSFTPDQWATVEAASARLIPDDDGDPGARQAQVVRYIDRQLALPDFVGLRRMFDQGLRTLDRLAHPRSFTALTAAEQDAVLRRMERGVGRNRGASRFFRVLLTFTVEGFLCDPIYGGNHDGVGWRFIGFEPRAPRPVAPYRSST